MRKLLLISLIVCALLIGCACADTQTADQAVHATVQPYTVTLTAPIDVQGWVLDRNVNNERDIGPVYISTTAPTFYLMRLNISSSSDRLTFDTGSRSSGVDTVMYISDITPPVPEVAGPTGWNMLHLGKTPVIQFDHAASPSPIAIPIRLRQFITTDDPDGDYGITFTYTLSVLSPQEMNIQPPPAPPS